MTISALDEYLRRNMLVAKSYGAEALLRSMAKRVNSRTRIPIWLATQLAEMQLRVEALTPELARHRDELDYAEVEAGLSKKAEAAK